MQALAQAFPSITEIAIMHVFPEANFCPILTVMEDLSLHGSARVWSRLQTLAISFIGKQKFPINELKDFLVNRSEMGCPVQTLLLPEAHVEEA